ncbi:MULTISPECIES: DUF421 domain-containing protein [Virgibacillus]|uniref:DUF421 domain-containing protein n=1 Tax=Virgibacillus dokdonensis TaxID=302167 RepID=A0A2K9J6L1_9BACI|nr:MULTISPECIES: DUF421 domain-containing protein [Virgibacillus]AUJ24870.1 hypothetical protein A21D_01789 [Virgibacillus dokdonensis]NWO13802.1 DUF421 domain-containing protein [Virgibacillus sp.]
MEWSWVWKAVLIIIGGTLLLRLAGRKSISQMTLAQTVIMIGIGSLLIQPLAGKNIWTTLGVGTVLVLTLIVMEFAQIKSDSFEGIITGKSKVLIHNGVIQYDQLKKLRLTTDQLEMNLRQKNISRIEDVEWATLEANGQIGYALKPEAQPATKGDIQQLYTEIKNVQHHLLAQSRTLGSGAGEKFQSPSNLFQEVADKGHDSNTTPPHQFD